jgi:hypothetical protein
MTTTASHIVVACAPAAPMTLSVSHHRARWLRSIQSSTPRQPEPPDRRQLRLTAASQGQPVPASLMQALPEGLIPLPVLRSRHRRAGCASCVGRSRLSRGPIPFLRANRSRPAHGPGGKSVAPSHRSGDRSGDAQPGRSSCDSGGAAHRSGTAAVRGGAAGLSGRGDGPGPCRSAGSFGARWSAGRSGRGGLRGVRGAVVCGAFGARWSAGRSGPGSPRGRTRAARR